MTTQQITRSEILSILDTIEGLLKQPGGWTTYNLERWTHWKCELARVAA